MDIFFKKHLKKGVIIGITLLALMILNPLKSKGKNEKKESTSVTETWTCSMHPQIQLPEFGLCPLCAMDLIPLDKQGGIGSENRLLLSVEAQKLAKVQTYRVQRKFVPSTILVTGKVRYDETQVSYISSWVSGRIDRLYVDYTGMSLRKGDHLALIYSPELLTAQQEYLQAMKSAKNAQNYTDDLMNVSFQETFENAYEKLRLLGVTKEQIQNLEASKEAATHMTIYSPTEGVVLTKEKKEGAYIETGTRLYKVVNISKLWVVFDIYERDLPWFFYGQKVSFEVEAYPGEIFEGTVSFISPIVDEKKHTISLRLNISNEDLRLKPGMFVRGQVSAKIAEDGEAVPQNLTGKWISPMHPEVIKDQPGECDVCGMDLVPTESLGFSEKLSRPPLVIPDTAPLVTGKRAIVYVAEDSDEGMIYEGREVRLGVKLDGYYIVKEGLKEGDQIVMYGAFKIDSAIQMKAGKSMMSFDDEGFFNEEHKVMPVFLEKLSPLYKLYFSIQERLAQGAFEGVEKDTKMWLEVMEKIDKTALLGQLNIWWMALLERGQDIKNIIHDERDIESYRERVFQPLSNLIIDIEKKFGHITSQSHYEMFCPMAFDDKGASWLQNKPAIENSYFADKMFSCGLVVKEYPGESVA